MEKELLGKGRFGKVYKVNKDDETIALKEIIIQAKNKEKALILGIDSTEELEEKTSEVMKEISFLNDLKGDSHIVNYVDYFVDKTEDQYTLSIEMELLHSLDSINNGILDEIGIKKLLDDMLDALQVLEEHHIVHGDIKPSNIMVDDYGNYKLTDFGISKILGQKLVGYTKAYAPREVLEEGRYTSSSDLYSLGLVIYQMFNKNLLPFMKDKNDFDSIHNRFDQELPRPEGMDDDFYEFLKTALNNKPEERYFNAKAMKSSLDYLYRENHIPAITISVTELILIVSKLTMTPIKGMEVKVINSAIDSTVKTITGSAIKKGIISKVASLPVIAKAGISAALVVSGGGYYKYKDYQNNLYEENIQIAEEHMENKEYDSALEYLNKARDINGRRYEAYEDMTKVYIDQDKGQKALDTLAMANSKLNDSNYKKVKKYEKPAYYNVYENYIKQLEKQLGDTRIDFEYNPPHLHGMVITTLLGIAVLSLTDYNNDGIDELTVVYDIKENYDTSSDIPKDELELDTVHTIVYTYSPKKFKCVTALDSNKILDPYTNFTLSTDTKGTYYILSYDNDYKTYTLENEKFIICSNDDFTNLMGKGKYKKSISYKIFDSYFENEDSSNLYEKNFKAIKNVKETLNKTTKIKF